MKITNIERYLLECIGDNKYGINEINFHTQLDSKIVKNCIHRLIAKGLLSLEGEFYFINKENLNRNLEELNSPSNLYREIRPLFNGLLWNGINKKKKTLFKLKKFSLNPTDEKILRNLIQNVDDFIKDNNTNGKDPFSQQKVFVCLMDQYLDAVK